MTWPGYGQPSAASFDPVAVTRGGGSSFAAPAGGVPGASGGVGPMVRFPPDVFPIPSAQELNAFGQASTAAVESDVELTGSGLPIVLPQNMLGRLSSISFYVANLALSSDLTFTVRINGGGVQGYTDVPIFPGTTARLTSIFETYIRVPAGGQVQVFYSNNDGGAYTVGVSITGWQWSQQDGDRWLNQGF